MNYFKEIKRLQERVDWLEEDAHKSSKIDDLADACEYNMRDGSQITFKEFFESNKLLAIHCGTRESANKLVKEFNKTGQEWVDPYWCIYQKQTCYSNHNGYCDKEFYERHDYTVYEFEDVIFEEEKFTEDEKVILRNLPKKFKWITRDWNGILNISMDKPLKGDKYWMIDDSLEFAEFDHLFKSIKWEDEEPCEFRKYL